MTYPREQKSNDIQASVPYDLSSITFFKACLTVVSLTYHLFFPPMTPTGTPVNINHPPATPYAASNLT